MIMDPTNDFEGLTACLDQVDLVITVQQSLVHFAGACGIQTEALIPYIPEWRYGTKGTKMEWWDSVTLRRQGKPGDWSEPIKRIKKTLENMKRERKII